jgi:predicted TPR repeat methyltransferase
VLGAPGGGLDIVDAGCGTGLCGPRVRSWARRLVGCDLSAGMLRRASEQHVYDVLHQAELTYYLDTQPEAFDIVISADTLCYFGALDTALAAARRSLRAGGWLVFTVEALPAAYRVGHRLQANGRYAHSKGYLESAVAGAGLSLMTLADGTLRLEAGLAVAGWVVTARRPSTGESRPDLGPEPRGAAATPQ